MDIGAGTGSISIEAALQGEKVWLLKKTQEGVEIININKSKFQVEVEVILGEAPEVLPDIKFNKCFLGGSGGKLEGIFNYLEGTFRIKRNIVWKFYHIKKFK